MTDTPSPALIETDNLSEGWADIVLRILRPGGSAISPLTLSITGFAEDGHPKENQTIRAAVDELLAGEDLRDVDNVAFTIFPQRYLAMVQGDRHALYELYLDAFHRIQDFNASHNRRGSYFQRLIDFSGDGKGPNQLEWILNEYHNHPKSRRRSKFQATTFDPLRDQSSTAQLEFPCLQQVSFTFEDDESLVMNAFYATQQMIHKGYGNYVGLSHLGAFMAKEMGRRLKRLNVFVGIAKADKMQKSNRNLQALLRKIQTQANLVPEIESA